MATFFTNVSYNFEFFPLSGALTDTALPGFYSNQSSTGFRVNLSASTVFEFGGSGFTFAPVSNQPPNPSNGIVNSIQAFENNVLAYGLTGIAKNLGTLRSSLPTAMLFDEIFPGADTITGSPANDTLGGGAGPDNLTGGAGIDLVQAFSNSFVYIDLQGAPGFFFDGASFDSISGFEGAIGGSANDILAGDAGANRFEGRGGDDALLGRDGDDLLIGDILTGGGPQGNDLLMGGTGYDPAETGTGNDQMFGNDGSDTLYGMDGSDTLRGGEGVDYVLAGAGNDSVEGGGGNDFLFGGSVYDFNAAGAGNDSFDGGEGIDFIVGGTGNDRITGGGGNDIMYGGSGDDTITDSSNNGGNETILGEDGNDTILGRSGFDYLYGGAGGDTFRFFKDDSFDNVFDFSAAEGDKIRLDPSLGVANSAALQPRLSGFTFEGADYTVFTTADGLDQLTLKGIALAAFVAAIDTLVILDPVQPPIHGNASVAAIDTLAVIG